MSGELIGRVIEHAPPDDPYLWSVLVVIAEDMHSPTDTALMSRAELVRRTRLSDATVKRAVARAIAGGWVKHWPGGGKGVASRYGLELARFPQALKGVPQTQYGENKGGLSDPVNEPKGVPQTSKGVPQTQSTVTVETPSSSTAPPDDALPVVVGVATADDDEAEAAFEGLAGVTATRHLRKLLGIALRERGHDASSVNAHLRATCSGQSEAPMAVVTVNLRDIPPRLVDTTPARRPWCGACDSDEHRWIETPTGDKPCPTCSPQASINGARRKRRKWTAADAQPDWAKKLVKST